MIIAVLVFVLLDFVTGITKALKGGSFRSSVMREGLWHKGGELLIIALGLACEYFLPWLGVDIQVPIVKAVCIYLYVMELASIIENLGEMFPELQEMLRKVFGRYTDRNE